MRSDRVREVSAPAKSATQPNSGTSAQVPATAEGSVEASAQEQRRAFSRGRALVGVGLVLLAVFALLTALVLLLDPLTFDVPITRGLQEINYVPFGWLMTAVSAPGFEPWNFIFPAAIICGLLLF